MFGCSNDAKVTVEVAYAAFRPSIIGIALSLTDSSQM